MQLNRAHNVNGDGVLYHTLARATRVSRDLRICSADKTPPFRDHCRCYAWVSNRAVGDSTLSVNAQGPREALPIHCHEHAPWKAYSRLRPVHMVVAQLNMGGGGL